MSICEVRITYVDSVNCSIMKNLALIVTLSIFLSACATKLAPPASAPTTYSDPPAISKTGYAVYKTTRVFDAPLVELREWIKGGARIVAAMEDTDRIKKPIEVKVVTGTWPQVGSVRWLKFGDGHYVFERVIVNEFPSIFRYQVWDHSNRAVERNIHYAVGQQAWHVNDSGEAELTWTYKLKPRGVIRRPFVQSFVNRNMRPLMDNALDVVLEQSKDAFPNGINESIDNDAR